MSYSYLGSSTPKARKKHRCEWCGEAIEIGEMHEASKFRPTSVKGRADLEID